MLMISLTLIACGKTGALYLPEEADAQQQNTDTSDKKAD